MNQDRKGAGGRNRDRYVSRSLFLLQRTQTATLEGEEMPNARARTHWFVLVCTVGLILGVMTTLCATVYYVGFYGRNAYTRWLELRQNRCQDDLFEYLHGRPRPWG